MNVIELQTVGSTNDYAKDLAKKGAVSGTVVRAYEQTAGRGRQGNRWESLQGNLFMSMILHPKIDKRHIGQLSFVSAVALANVFEKILPPQTRLHLKLKWPNDILIHEKKAAGILIETENGAPWVVVGFGVNVEFAPENAVSLHDIGVKSCDSKRFLDLLIVEMEALVEKWEKNGFGEIRKAWLDRAYKLDETITARLLKEDLTGVFEGIDRDGGLQLRMTDKSLRTIHSGEIFAA